MEDTVEQSSAGGPHTTANKQRLGGKQQHHLIIVIQQQIIICFRDLQDGLVQTGEHKLPLGAVSQVVADHLNTGKSN